MKYIFNIDNYNDIEKRYSYDISGRLITAKENDNYKIEYYYDQYSNISKKEYTLREYIKEINYTFDIDNKLTNIEDISYTYDTLERLNKKTITSNNNTYEVNYNYINIDTSKTTSIIESIENDEDVLSYTYDDIGNITEVKQNNTTTNEYYYDNLNQLIKEDNVELNKTIVYT